MSNIGKALYNAAKAINPFEGTVNTGKTSTGETTFCGIKITNATSAFALRKIYNSIKFAPGHAFNAVGLKSFTNYLYRGTTGKEKAAANIKEVLVGIAGGGEAIEGGGEAIEGGGEAIEGGGEAIEGGDEAKKKEAAATKIQAFFRGKVGRYKANLTEENLEIHNQNNKTDPLSKSTDDENSSDDGSDSSFFKSVSSVASNPSTKSFK